MSGLIETPAQLWLAVEPVDMRRGIDGLSAIAQQALGHSGIRAFAVRGVGLCVPQSLGQSFETVIVGWQWRVAVSASYTRESLYLAEGLRSLFFVDSGRVALANCRR